MLETVAILLMCQLAGEAVTRLLALPVPGPVFGLTLFFVLLLVRPQMAARVAPTCPEFSAAPPGR